jgi:predicted nucleic acid-binding protein
MSTRFATSKDTIARLERARLAIEKQEVLVKVFDEYLESYEKDVNEDMLKIAGLAGELPNDQLIALLAERKGFIASIKVVRQGLYRPSTPAGYVENPKRQLV